MKKIVVLGAGGFACEVMNLLEENNASGAQWEILGCIDSSYCEASPQKLLGYPMLGNDRWAEQIQEPICAVCAIGDPNTRKRIVRWYKEHCPLVSFPTLIHNKAQVSKHSVVGEGAIICGGCFITVEIEMGDFSIVNLACTIGHGTKVGAFSTLHPGVNVSGDVTVGSCVEIGTGAKIIQGINIGAETTVGAGSVVVRDIPASVIAFGAPCRVVRKK